MISQPVFFVRDDWVADHADWHPRIQGGKTIDILHGDGRRILAERLERTVRLRPEAEPLATELSRYGAPQVVQPRLGQGTFRIAVTSAYGACAVSGEHSLPALEAAHLRPYADGGERALSNGLLLRADIHRLVRRRLRHRYARPPLPREPRPRRRLPQAAASTSVSPAAPSLCRMPWPIGRVRSCSTGTRRTCSGAERHLCFAIVILVRHGDTG